MPRKEDEPTARVHVHLFADDIEWIKDVYGDSTNIGFSSAVRQMVRKFRRYTEGHLEDMSFRVDKIDLPKKEPKSDDQPTEPQNEHQ